MQRGRVVGAGLALIAGLLLSSCGGGGGTTTTIDQTAFAKKVQSTTSFDKAQSACVARQVFDHFTVKDIETLYTKGVEPLRRSLPGQLYVVIAVGCSV